ncbi:MAG: hypothetical protein JWQ36_1238 [Enterovirga sp.]|jgi:hypothetical protein|nr:hypothetical protein [Enterovirga sp.]
MTPFQILFGPTLLALGVAAVLLFARWQDRHTP